MNAIKKTIIAIVILSIFILSGCSNSTPESKAKSLALKQFDKEITESNNALLGLVTKAEIKDQINKIINARNVSGIESENGSYIVTIYSKETMVHEFKYKVSDKGTVTKIK